MQLGSKFCVRMGFPSDDWPNLRLADADDTVRYHMDTVFVHVQLLLVQRCDGIQKICNFFFHFQMGFPNNIQNKPNIPLNILQLLPNAFPQFFCGTFLAFGKLHTKI